MFLPLLRTFFFLFDSFLRLLFSDAGCRSCLPAVEIDTDSDTDLPEIST